MNFTGTIWRPPYEAWSALLQVTAGCTHHKCKFCTLYEDVPFKFRMSPMDEIESDLKELSELTPKATRLFLTGANPFVLNTQRLKEIAYLSKQYLPKLTSIGCFARITDITPKTIDELKELRATGYNRVTIGVETGDDEALAFMNKGYDSQDIIEQCGKLGEANIEYNIFYLTGIYGAGKSAEGVKNTAEVFNRLAPKIIGASMLTVFPESELYSEILRGSWHEENETEKLEEMKLLIKSLDINVHFAALGASNLLNIQGKLPRDKTALTAAIDELISTFGEERLREYRTSLRQL